MPEKTHARSQRNGPGCGLLKLLRWTIAQCRMQSAAIVVLFDDLLDVQGTAEQLGKRTQKDSARGKATYPAILGIERSLDLRDLRFYFIFVRLRLILFFEHNIFHIPSSFYR